LLQIIFNKSLADPSFINDKMASEVQMMNSELRIPSLKTVSFDGAVQWFTEMANRGLLFHPDDDPADMILIKTGEPMFSDQEAESARQVLNQLFDALGEDVYEIASPIMRQACCGSSVEIA
jgi:hypothetical protein